MGTLDDHPLKYEHIPENRHRIRRLYYRDRFSNWLQRLSRRLSIKRYMKLNRGKQHNETRHNGDTNAVVHRRKTSHNTNHAGHLGAITGRAGGRWHRWGNRSDHSATGQRRAPKSSVVDDQLDLEK